MDFKCEDDNFNQITPPSNISIMLNQFFKEMEKDTFYFKNLSNGLNDINEIKQNTNILLNQMKNDLFLLNDSNKLRNSSIKMMPNPSTIEVMDVYDDYKRCLIAIDSVMMKYRTAVRDYDRMIRRLNENIQDMISFKKSIENPQIVYNIIVDDDSHNCKDTSDGNCQCNNTSTLHLNYIDTSNSNNATQDQISFVGSDNKRKLLSSVDPNKVVKKSRIN
jgi:hypothetical protein